jgi:hypothetical protein
MAATGNYCQGSVHLAEGFQRRRLKCEKLTADGCQVMTKAHIAFGNVSQKSNFQKGTKSNKERFSFANPQLTWSNKRL